MGGRVEDFIYYLPVHGVNMMWFELIRVTWGATFIRLHSTDWLYVSELRHFCRFSRLFVPNLVIIRGGLLSILLKMLQADKSYNIKGQGWEDARSMAELFSFGKYK
jgi:hypothetical protein